MAISSTYLSFIIARSYSPLLIIVANNFLRKTFIESSRIIIIDVNKENKVSVLAENYSKDVIKELDVSKSLVGSY